MSGDTNEGDHACVGAEGIWEIFVSSDQLCCDTKIALKTKVYQKKKNLKAL